MPIGNTSFDTTFIFKDDPKKQVGFGAIPTSNGLAQLLIILVVLVCALGLSLFVLFENGSGPPDLKSRPGEVLLFEGGGLPLCIDNPGLSETGFSETLRGRQPIAGDIPRLRFEDYCYVPVF